MLKNAKVTFIKPASSKSDSLDSIGEDEPLPKIETTEVVQTTPTAPAFRLVRVVTEPIVHPVTDMPEIVMSSAIKERTETRSVSKTSDSCRTNEAISAVSVSASEDPQPLLTMLEQRAAKKGKVLKHTRTESPITHWKQHKTHVTNIGFAVVLLSCLFLFSALAVTIVYFVENDNTVKEFTNYSNGTSLSPYSNDKSSYRHKLHRSSKTEAGISSRSGSVLNRRSENKSVKSTVKNNVELNLTR